MSLEYLAYASVVIIVLFLVTRTSSNLLPLALYQFCSSVEMVFSDNTRPRILCFFREKAQTAGHIQTVSRSRYYSRQTTHPEVATASTLQIEAKVAQPRELGYFFFRRKWLTTLQTALIIAIRRLSCNCISFLTVALACANEQYYGAWSVAQHGTLHSMECCTAHT